MFLTLKDKRVNDRLNVVSAKTTCELFGKDWEIKRTNEGSIVCAKVPAKENCHDCRTWRLLVWIDGACDLTVTPNVGECEGSGTKAGHYYCGYHPCKGGPLGYGGPWAVGIYLLAYNKHKK